MSLIRKLLWHLLQFGYQADLACNGKEAVEAVERQKYEMLLMDLQMPEHGGLEATPASIRNDLERFRAALYCRPDRQRDEEDHEECLAAGMDDFLTNRYALKKSKPPSNGPASDSVYACEVGKT